MTGHHGREEETDPLAETVRRYGLLSAAAVVDRYVAVVDRVVSAGARTVGGPAGAGPADQAGDLGEVTTRAVRAVLDVLGSTRQGPHDKAPSAVVLAGAEPGGRADGRLWVHGPRDRPTLVGLHATGLVSDRGSTIDARHITLAPARVHVAAGGSAEVVVSVAVPADAAPGRYHGVLVCSAARTTPLGLVLHVRPVGDDHGA